MIIQHTLILRQDNIKKIISLVSCYSGVMVAAATAITLYKGPV